MAEFFHVDRGRQLQLNQELGYIPSTFVGFGGRIASEYEGSLTHFGHRHLTPANHPLYYVEHFLEAMRTGHFPEKPSRFRSVFGCHSIEDAKKFVDKTTPSPTAPPPYWIWRVEADSWFDFDMNLLVGNVALPQTYDSALQYWSGGKSAQPLLEVLMKPPVHVREMVLEYGPRSLTPAVSA